MKINSFKDLIAWQKAHEFALVVYKVTDKFPENEKFRLIDQLRRAVVSITSNIAEGFSRKSSKEKINFYLISLGSITEVQSQLVLAKDLNYLNKERFDELEQQSIVVHKLCNGLIKACRGLIT